MKTYQVTLAQLAWIKGTDFAIKAESWADAFAKAKASEGDGANWPIDEDGDEVRGFGDIEIDRAYCDEEAEPDHEGEAPAADVLVYKAAPALAAALQALADCFEFTDAGHVKVIETSPEVAARHEAALAALRAAGVEG